jgi:tetratricopeptide (TPR) repeat protein
MTTWRRWTSLAVLLVLTTAAMTRAQPGRATVREYRKVFRTYPFFDPNPIAQVGRIYPYFRFEGYTDKPIDREWTVIELENQFLRVTILPEIGGKIWSAVEKSTGRSFIYNNQVVKFRDIAMRGPWTSGGIEPNYGIIGHTPNCATPVDYSTQVTADGATVFIGVFDLLTRTPWRLVITLPHDKAYFTTRSVWHNQTPIEQPYYTWMNTGIKAAGNLELIYPGTHYLGHGGEVFPWPTNASNGKNLSFYEQNDFGPYKSYHVFGRYSDFFGAYWHDDDFGMGRYSTRDDKLGKKAWIWGLSRQGMIWEKLLTDTDGQYVEVQSGRLFNQAAEGSTFTPFKHRGFEPYSTDTWTEYWFPVKGTRGYVKANERGALNVVLPGTVRPGVGETAPAVTARAMELRFSPTEAVNDTLWVLDGERVVYSAQLALRPMETWSQSITAQVPAERLRVRIGNWMDYRPVAGDELSRPVESPKDFDWQSVQGLHLKGKEWMRQRDYVQAQAALEACLEKDQNYLPALADLAIVRYRAMDYQGAWDLARRGLAIDTYDPASNYYYGLASVRLGRTVDALDGFEVAASSPAFRSAAHVELAKIHLRRGDLARTGEYADRARQSNADNFEALQLLTVIARLRGNTAAASDGDAASPLPLNHFARFESYLRAKDQKSRNDFVDGIRNEMPHETFLELAAWYHDLGLLQEARQALELAPQNGEVLYWLAFVQDALRNPASVETLRKADAASPRLVFPFRSESAPVFEWAMRQTDNWRPKYYLALILWSRNEVPRARDLLSRCADAPDFAPFYAARARAMDQVSREKSLGDLRRAAEIDPREWRFGKLLTERFIEDHAFEQALDTAARYFKASPDNYMLGMLHAKALLLNRRFADASEALGKLNVLPYEGSTEARALYREAELMVSAAEMKGGRADAALRRVTAAREWPEHLGAGKPYAEDVDERLEDWLAAQCLKQGRPAEARALLERLATSGRTKPGAGRLLSALASKSVGRQEEAQRTLEAWTSQQHDARVADWGRRVFNGERPAWPEGAPATEEWRVLAEWFRMES